MNVAEPEIARLCAVYENSVYQKNYEGLLTIYHDNIFAFDLWGNGVYEGKADWSASMKDWLGSLPENEKVEAILELSKVTVDESTAFAYGTVTYRAVDSNNVELRKMKNRLTWGIVNVEGNWLIAHQHTSVPIEGETTQAIFLPE